jgi:hypothetical protein
MKHQEASCFGMRDACFEPRRAVGACCGVLDVIAVSPKRNPVDMRWLARGTTEQLRIFEAANDGGARDAAGQSPGDWTSGSTLSGLAGGAEASFCT